MILVLLYINVDDPSITVYVIPVLLEIYTDDSGITLDDSGITLDDSGITISNNCVLLMGMIPILLINENDSGITID